MSSEKTGPNAAAGSPPVDIPPEWLAEFEAAARRPLATRIKYAFIHTYKPVLDDAPFRVFDTMEEYPVRIAPIAPVVYTPSHDSGAGEGL